MVIAASTEHILLHMILVCAFHRRDAACGELGDTAVHDSAGVPQLLGWRLRLHNFGPVRHVPTSLPSPFPLPVPAVEW